MHIRNFRQIIIDDLIDVVGIKSGLLINEIKAFEFLKELEPNWWNGDKEEIILIEITEYEIAFIHLMYELGAIQNKKDKFTIIFDFIEEYSTFFKIDSKNIRKIIEVTQDIEHYILENIFSNKKIPKKFSELDKFDKLLLDYKDRYLMHCKFPEYVTWNGIIPLNTLFEEENIPDGASPDCYFDQRYIDYLNRQKEEIGNIHWRQFEYLTGEFFQKNGYSVEVMKGRNDGGIDVIAKRIDDISGPEMISIQCKKYSESNPVEIEAVRAFWATINDNESTKGIIITTSRLTKGAKEYCKAKMYRLDSMEYPKVESWIQSMSSKKIN